MAKQTINTKKKALLSADFLNRLVTMDDLRVGEYKPISSRFSFFFKIIGRNFSQILLTNLLFLLFATPLFVLYLWYQPTQIRSITNSMYFMSNFGVGFGGNPTANIEALTQIYDLKMMVALYAIPCIAFLGIGFAGVYFVSRNMVWGVKVNILKHFFRGIKLHWWKFLIGTSFLSLEIGFLMYAFLNNSKLALTRSTTPLSWFLVVLSVLLIVLTIPFMQISSPMFVAYKFKYKHVIKNTIILSLALVLTITILDLALFLPLLLFKAGIFKYLVYIFVVSMGAMYYGIANTLLANYGFESFIKPVHDIREKKEARKTASINPAKKEKVIDVEARVENNVDKKHKQPVVTMSEEDKEKQKKKEKYLKSYNRKKDNKK